MSELIEKQKVLDALREIATEKFSLDDPYGVYINVLIDVEEKICSLPVVQPNGPDNLVKDSQVLAKDLANDTISRKAALDALEWKWAGKAAFDAIKALPSAQLKQQWIPFKTRPLTEEEKEEHPEWDCILDCRLPDDGQRILVAIRIRGHEEVQQDEFYSDDGSYLDSGYEIGTEAVAWMPLPEPYSERRQE